MATHKWHELRAKMKPRPPIILPAYYDTLWDWNVSEVVMADNDNAMYLPSNWIMDTNTMIYGKDNRKYV